MVAGSLLPHIIGKPTPLPRLHEALHHHAAARTEHVPEPPHRHSPAHGE